MITNEKEIHLRDFTTIIWLEYANNDIGKNERKIKNKIKIKTHIFLFEWTCNYFTDEFNWPLQNLKSLNFQNALFLQWESKGVLTMTHTILNILDYYYCYDFFLLWNKRTGFKSFKTRTLRAWRIRSLTILLHSLCHF